MASSSSSKVSLPYRIIIIVLLLFSSSSSSKGQQLPEANDGTTIVKMKNIIDTLDSLSLQLKEHEAKMEEKVGNLEVKMEALFEEKVGNLEVKMEALFEEQRLQYQQCAQRDQVNSFQIAVATGQQQLGTSLQQCSTTEQILEFQDLLATDECEEASHNCSEKATCTDSRIQYKCTCLTGYSGDGFTCQDVDECSEKKDECSSTEQCLNNPGSYSCECREGFQREEGDICQDVDECSEEDELCPTNEVCLNSPGSYTCVCDEGFEKEGGDLCQDVDECSEEKELCNITTNEVCLNNPGSYTCICLEGFEREGDVCQDVDECRGEKVVCGTNEECFNNPGSYTCNCSKYFTKEGDMCKSSVCESPSLLHPSLGCLKLVSEMMDLDAAKSKCQSLGLRLAEGIQRQHMESLGQHFNPINDDWFMWIGLRNGRWLTSGGEKEEEEVSEEDWIEGEPDGGDQECGLVDVIPPGIGLGDRTCSSTRYVLCQSLP